jgi:hypothetical protein
MKGTDVHAVLQMRHTYQGTMRTELVTVVKRLTGHEVAAFMSDNHVDPGVAVETFVLELRDGGPDRERTRHRRDTAPARATRPASRSATRAARRRRGREELLCPPESE